MKLAEEGSISSISTAVVIEGEGVIEGVWEGAGVWVEKGNGLSDGKGKGEKKEIAIGTASKAVNIILRQFKMI